jgi:predicted nucleic acid-binding Zn ribbon protein
MNCPSCGKEIPDGSTFCLHCGKSTQAAPEKKKRYRANFGWFLLGVLLMALVGILLLNVVQSSSPSPATSIPTREQLTSGQTIVKPGAYFYQKFVVDADRIRDARIIGSFNASGGAGNDIEVLLLEESSFENWKNGHSAPTLYNSGQITTGKIDVPLNQAGTYYLVFSNTFSPLTEKQVFSNISLTYLPAQ